MNEGFSAVVLPQTLPCGNIVVAVPSALQAKKKSDKKRIFDKESRSRESSVTVELVERLTCVISK